MLAHDAGNGAISDGAIRYLMIRPDVLMGVAHELPPDQAQAFLRALERSAFRHSRESFERYRASGRFGTDDFLARTAAVAADLGWGAWVVAELGNGGRLIEVRNSPFVAGHGHSAYPVCAAISGVLRAIALVGYEQRSDVRETECAAQSGGPVCRFHITPARS
ncbi:MAG TPA: 4-vinyl reductase [Steroidobacteraceae bacterium]|nr:4-vinyl reductase [Steroidobacteraceae bacterium]